MQEYANLKGVKNLLQEKFITRGVIVPRPRKKKQDNKYLFKIFQIIMLLGSAYLGYKVPAIMPVVDNVQEIIITGYDGDTAPERGINEQKEALQLQ